jgi:hypothetical protein
MNRILDIESLRTRLYHIVEHCQGNLLDPQVVKASQQLDEALMWHVYETPLRPRFARAVRFQRGFTPKPVDHAAAR